MMTPPFMDEQLQLQFSEVFNPDKILVPTSLTFIKREQITSHKSPLHINPYSFWSDQVTSFRKSLSEAPVNEGSAPATPLGKLCLLTS